MVSGFEFLLIGIGALAAGAVNALAGGGTLITFPLLTAVGIPAVAANVTNSVALCPGFLGGTYAQLEDLRGQRRRLRLLVPLGMLGGVAGGYLLLQTGERLFRELVPYLILMAAGLLALQEPLRGWLQRRAARRGTIRASERWAAAPIAAGAIYGGYFGAGLGVLMLATLGLTLEDSLTRLNALKQLLSFVINATAAVYFVFSDQVVWAVAAVMAVGALLGGLLGGRLAGRIRPATLRHVVVAIGCLVAALYFLH